MKKLSVSLAILALTLAFGLAFVACKTEADDPLNGTWRRTIGGLTEEYTFDNGTFVRKDPAQDVRGTYSTSGNQITITVTEFYVSAEQVAVSGISERVGWYNKNQVAEVFRKLGMTEEQINEQLASMFTPETYNYTLDGNTMTLAGVTYQRR